MELEKFNTAALAYCKWAEGDAKSPEQDVVEALRHLTKLYALALSLPDIHGEEDALNLSVDDFKHLVQRFSNLPFELYAVCFNPLDLDKSHVVGSISDDLADIWRDLYSGVNLYSAGHQSAAAWHWRFHFLSHWGRHVVSAISALHVWLANNPSAMPSNSSLSE
ncbi:MAG: DUF5063 domain-containing protein [Chloroflexi bacterium]|nr:DUF5063 domain-containing protein [Chloroflexota bacterium]